MYLINCLLGLCLVFASIDFTASSFASVYRKLGETRLDGSENVGEPLFLTSYIESGRIKEGREAAYVKPFAKKIESYSGYFTVNKTYNSNLFFWYFPAQAATPDTPVVLWLQGGPGATSLFGLFEEHGPFFIDKSGQPQLRKYSWTKVVSMIYIDNPVGTGFSFSDYAGYSKDQVDVGENLYSAIFQFYQLFPDLQKNEFYITGESYAGKYVPAAAYAIHTKNPAASFKINLKGIAIGNGLVDPINMLGRYGDYVNQLGLIDSNTLNQFRSIQTAGIEYIKQQNWAKATETFDSLILGDFKQNQSLFFNATGFTFYFNFLNAKGSSPYGDFATFVQNPSSRKRLHVGNSTFHTDDKVEVVLKEDLAKSVKPWVETLLEHYKVLVYNGQLDIIVAYPLTVGFLQALNWSAANEYTSASRHIWKVEDEIFGYVKTAGNLTELLVRDAGHMVPGDQPAWAFDMISRFIFNKPYF